MTWSMEYKYGRSYPLDGYDTSLSTTGMTKEQVLSSIKHTYLDKYHTTYGAEMFSIELTPSNDDAFLYAVYYG